MLRAETAAPHLLSDHVNDLTAADYGLAMAMAGNPDEAICVLSQAIHATTALAPRSARTSLMPTRLPVSGPRRGRSRCSILRLWMLFAKRVLQWAQSATGRGESTRNRDDGRCAAW